MLLRDPVQRGCHRCGSGQLGHLGARVSQRRFGLGQDFLWRPVRAQRDLELRFIGLAAQAPDGRAFREIGGEPHVEFLQRRESRLGGLVVIRFQLGWDARPEGLVDQGNVPGVLFARHAVPQFGRVLQVFARLFQQNRDGRQPLHDVAIARRLRGVL